MTETVASTVRSLDTLLKSHAGGLELQSIDAQGLVSVRFTGMCVGCELKPVTAARVVRPVLEGLEGVTGVHIAGGRVSEFAQAALEASACGTSDLAGIHRAIRVVHQTREPEREEAVGGGGTDRGMPG